MIIDYELELSDAQTVTADAVSEDVFDVWGGRADSLGVSLAGRDNLFAYVTVADDMSGLTDITVTLETATDEAFTSPIVLHTGATVAAADALTGKVLLVLELGGQPLERYLRYSYDVTGTGTVDVNGMFVESIPFNNK